MRYITFSLLLFLSTGCQTNSEQGQIVPNPKHFGCWKYLTNQVEGITNTLRLCISSDEIDFSIYFPNNPSPDDDTTCLATGALIGTGENDLRLYEVEEGTCTNGRETQPLLLSCTNNNSNLKCEDLVRSVLNGEVKPKLRNTFIFIHERP